MTLTTRYLQEHLATIKNDGAHLKFWLDSLCSALSDYLPRDGGNSAVPTAVASNSPFGISQHTASVLRNLILFIGSTWVEESKKRPELRRVVIQNLVQAGQEAQHVVDLLGFSEGLPQSPEKENAIDISIYLAEKIGSVSGLYWASGLLQVSKLKFFIYCQPTPEAISGGWFSKVVESIDNTTTEFDILAILGQVDWVEAVQQIHSVSQPPSPLTIRHPTLRRKYFCLSSNSWRFSQLKNILMPFYRSRK